MKPSPYYRDTSPRLRLSPWAILAALVLIIWTCNRYSFAQGEDPIVLWLEAGVLGVAPEHLELPVPLLSEDFAHGASRWMSWTDPNVAGMRGDLDGMQISPFAGDGVELSGPRGGLSLLVPVEAGMALRFRGAAWVDELRPKEWDSANLSGGFRLEEMEHWPRAAALVPRRIAQFGAQRFTLEGPALQRTWSLIDETLRVGPRTNALLISCILSTDAILGAGLARFRSISLDAIPLNEHWHRQLRRAARQLRQSPGPYFEVLSLERRRLKRRSSFPSRADLPEFAHRRVLVGVKGTVPGLVLLPGESIHWSLRVPRGEPLLQFDLAPWLPPDSSLDPDVDSEARVRIQVNGQLQADHIAMAGLMSRCELDLGAWRGQRISLRLFANGADPVALARPEIGPFRSVQAGSAGDTDEGTLAQKH